MSQSENPGMLPRLLLPLQVIISFLCLYGLYLLRPVLSPEGAERADAPGKNAAPPLILVHPAMQNRAAWYFYQRAFRKAGFSELYYFEYSCAENSLSDTAQRLARLVEDALANNPGSKPILIGASLGGLLARNALCFLPHPERLGGLVTLACPHKGSRLAKLIPKKLFPLLHSISYASPAIVEMESKENEKRIDLPKTAFFSCIDEMVIPSCALLPPENQKWAVIQTKPLSHMSIMLHFPTINAVTGIIKKLS